MQGKAKLSLDVKGDVTAKLVCEKIPTQKLNNYHLRLPNHLCVRSTPCAWQDAEEFWTTPPPERDM